jgi:hypothetical protein
MALLSQLEMAEPLPVPLSRVREDLADEAFRLGLIRLARRSEEPFLRLTSAGFRAIDQKRDARQAKLFRPPPLKGHSLMAATTDTSTLDPCPSFIEASVDPLAELRSQRVLLLTAIRETEQLLATVVFRSRDELAAAALTELLLQMREHLMLEAFVDRTDTAPPAAAHDTLPPPADPTLLTCAACEGTGIYGTCEDDARVCVACHGQGCT